MYEVGRVKNIKEKKRATVLLESMNSNCKLTLREYKLKKNKTLLSRKTQDSEKIKIKI